MLKAFPDAYEATIPINGGPKMTVEKASEVVLGTAGPGLKMYESARKDYPALFPAYRYHFMTNSKPATHLAALAHIDENDLKSDMPPILSKLVEHIAKSLRRD